MLLVNDKSTSERCLRHHHSILRMLVSRGKRAEPARNHRVINEEQCWQGREALAATRLFLISESTTKTGWCSGFGFKDMKINRKFYSAFFWGTKLFKSWNITTTHRISHWMSWVINSSQDSHVKELATSSKKMNEQHIWSHCTPHH